MIAGLDELEIYLPGIVIVRLVFSRDVINFIPLGTILLNHIDNRRKDGKNKEPDVTATLS